LEILSTGPLNFRTRGVSSVKYASAPVEIERHGFSGEAVRLNRQVDFQFPPAKDELRRAREFPLRPNDLSRFEEKNSSRPFPNLKADAML
jgi:hypothetical protein